MPHPPLLQNRKKEIEIVFFTEKFSNEIFRKIRNSTKYLRPAKHRLPQATILDEMKKARPKNFWREWRYALASERLTLPNLTL